jgi:hypothetical protein
MGWRMRMCTSECITWEVEEANWTVEWCDGEEEKKNSDLVRATCMLLCVFV